MNGIIILDKPKGYSSFEVLKMVKEKFGVKKAGYLGTLDPLATGVLVVFLEAATRLIRYFEEGDKEYEITLELGKTSDTYDRMGKVTICHPERSEGSCYSTNDDYSQTRSFAPQQVRGLRMTKKVLQQFIGNIWQIQPPFSAVHIDGKRAYERARRGEKVNLGKRQVTISDLQLLDSKPPFYCLKMTCSSGTYARSLVHELGKTLRTGAILTALKRTRSGPFQIKDAHGLEFLNTTHVLEPQHVIKQYLPKEAWLLSQFSIGRV